MQLTFSTKGPNTKKRQAKLKYQLTLQTDNNTIKSQQRRHANMYISAKINAQKNNSRQS
jgi:hypothetical protein